MKQIPQLFAAGQRVRITSANFPEHAHTVGMVGTIERFVKSRGVYRVQFQPQGAFAFPQRLEKFETNLANA